MGQVPLNQITSTRRYGHVPALMVLGRRADSMLAARVPWGKMIRRAFLKGGYMEYSWK